MNRVEEKNDNPGILTGIADGPLLESGTIYRHPAPIWMAALLASSCRALAGESEHPIRWDCGSDCALYTNRSAEAEVVDPFGVTLQGGDTLAVSWMAGETGYNLEVFSYKPHYLI